MAANIKLKRSAIAGRKPTDLDYGELAINYNDGILYYKDDLNNISTISSGEAVTDSAAPEGATVRDGVLWWDAVNGRLKVYYDDGQDSAQWVDAAPAGRGYTGSAGAIVFSESAPSNPSDGQIWYNSSTGKSYMYYEANGNRAWILFADPTVTDGDTGYSGSQGYAGSVGSTSPRLFSYPNPTNGSRKGLLYTTSPITITEVRSVVQNGSASWSLVTSTDYSDATPTTISTGATNNTTTGVAETITSASVPAGQWIWVIINSAPGCDELVLNVSF